VLTDPVYLVLTWGKPLEAPLAETCESFLAQTRRYWTTWVKHASLPERFQEPVIRSALTLKLHQFEDTGAITAATTTSIPEHPGSGRTWDYRYCWLRDSCFTLGALRRLGHFEEMERFITYLHSIGESAGDRLQPVYGINGQNVLTESVLDHLRGYRGEGPVRVGNHAYAQTQHDVYGEMIAALAPLFLDVRFRDHADSRSIKLLHTLLRAIETHIEAPDAGLWEKRHDHRLHTFSLLMHWLGASTASRVGARCGDSTLAEQGHMLAERARAIIEKRTWRPELGCYSDVTEGDTVDASLMLMVNLGYVPPGHPHAESHVLHLASQLSANDHLLHRYRHHDGIGDTHATFTMCGLWHAEALARLGRVREAEQVFTSILGYANHVGLLSEDIDPATGEQWGNFPQTYSHVGLINAAFAISPMSGPIL
jgi:GH15 family glucan-1,4-alpha-glucosidase